MARVIANRLVRQQIPVQVEEGVIRFCSCCFIRVLDQPRSKVCLSSVGLKADMAVMMAATGRNGGG